MNQPLPPDDDLASTSEPSISQRVENSTLGVGIQNSVGDGNVQIQGDGNQVQVSIHKAVIPNIQTDWATLLEQTRENLIVISFP